MNGTKGSTTLMQSESPRNTMTSTAIFWYGRGVMGRSLSSAIVGPQPHGVGSLTTFA